MNSIVSMVHLRGSPWLTTVDHSQPYFTVVNHSFSPWFIFGRAIKDLAPYGNSQYKGPHQCYFSNENENEKDCISLNENKNENEWYRKK